MKVFKYSVITALFIVLTGCSSVPATDSSTPMSTDVGNADIQCIQEGLNTLDVEVENYDLNAGAENGVMNQNTETALVNFENMIQAKLPVLTDQSAAGHCDVLLHRAFTRFDLGIYGEAGADLKFQLYSTDNITAETEPVASVPFTSGVQERVFIGESIMQQVSTHCVIAPEGYGFTDTSGQMYPATCESIPQELKTAGARTGYVANLVKAD